MESLFINCKLLFFWLMVCRDWCEIVSDQFLRKQEDK